MTKRRVVRIEDRAARERTDELAREEPLEIRVCGRQLAVTMRTPGHDFELVAGFLHAEGLLGDRRDVVAMRYCGAEPQEFNVVDAALASDPDVGARRVLTTSACGVCGSASIEDVARRSRFDVAADDTRVTASVVATLPARLRRSQKAFERTGGLHAAGLFSADGELVCVREDVGRHNAFDKVIGWALLEGRLPLRGHVLLASGRASFELAQKSILAGAPVLAAVSAPSTLACDLARDAGLTLIGFLRGSTMNVYAHPRRVVLDLEDGLGPNRLD